MKRKIQKRLIKGFVILSLAVVMMGCQKKGTQNSEGVDVTQTEEPTTTPTDTNLEPEQTEIPDEIKEPEESAMPEETQAPESTKEPEETKEPEVTEEPKETTTPASTKKPTVTTKPEPTKKPAPTKKPEPTKKPTPTKKPKPTEKPKADQELKGSLEEIMEDIYSNVTAELPKVWNQEVTKENSSYYLGIENMEFEEALASEAMMTSMAHSICLVRVKDGTDVKAIEKEIKEKVNPNKWICVGVEPENVKVDHIGNVIILVMTNHAPDEFIESFRSLKE